MSRYIICEMKINVRTIVAQWDSAYCAGSREFDFCNIIYIYTNIVERKDM